MKQKDNEITLRAEESFHPKGENSESPRRLAPLTQSRPASGEAPARLGAKSAAGMREIHNQVERWFGLIAQRAIRRGSFDSVTDLKRRIEEFVANYNRHPAPFVWTASPDSILEKIERLSRVINGTRH